MARAWEHKSDTPVKNESVRSALSAGREALSRAALSNQSVCARARHSKRRARQRARRKRDAAVRARPRKPAPKLKDNSAGRYRSQVPHLQFGCLGKGDNPSLPAAWTFPTGRFFRGSGMRAYRPRLGGPYRGTPDRVHLPRERFPRRSREFSRSPIIMEPPGGMRDRREESRSGGVTRARCADSWELVYRSSEH